MEDIMRRYLAVRLRIPESQPTQSMLRIAPEYFEQQNEKNISGAQHVSLESVAIGNGWYDPLLQVPSYYRFLVDPGNT